MLVGRGNSTLMPLEVHCISGTSLSIHFAESACMEPPVGKLDFIKEGGACCFTFALYGERVT